MKLFSPIFVRKSKAFTLYFCFSALVLYFGYFFMSGDRGLSRFFELKREIKEAQQILDEKREIRDKLAHKVKLLSSESLDLDLLEERVRIVLNLAAKDEIIIIDDDKELKEEQEDKYK